jgi:hypothetical protein
VFLGKGSSKTPKVHKKIKPEGCQKSQKKIRLVEHRNRKKAGKKPRGGWVLLGKALYKYIVLHVRGAAFVFFKAPPDELSS